MDHWGDALLKAKVPYGVHLIPSSHRSMLTLKSKCYYNIIINDNLL